MTALAAAALDAARQVERLETQRERLEEENKALKGRLAQEVAGRRIVALAPPMRRVLDVIERVAPRGVSVLVRGESGTGKELVAKLLHHLSGREGALIAVNCAALPESLLESELFGIEGGVATGVQARPGKFELADRGTLFLDEIGDMQTSLQVRLLRALQEREVTRVGGRRPIPVDVRLVAATHQDLEALIGEGRFREDLYYRLKGVEVELPPLRERKQDIPHLVRAFLEEFCRREGIPVPALRSEALALLLAYDFPGNVRELQNVVEGAVSLADGEIDAELIRSLLGDAHAGLLPRGARPRDPGAAPHRPRPQADRRQQERGGEGARARPQDVAAQGLLSRNILRGRPSRVDEIDGRCRIRSFLNNCSGGSPKSGLTPAALLFSCRHQPQPRPERLLPGASFLRRPLKILRAIATRWSMRFCSWRICLVEWRLSQRNPTPLSQSAKRRSGDAMPWSPSSRTAMAGCRVWKRGDGMGKASLGWKSRPLSARTGQSSPS